MNNLSNFYENSENLSQYSKKYFEYLQKLTAEIDSASIQEYVNLLLQARESKATIFFMGNGGSASTASHFVCDLINSARLSDIPFKAISLSDNIAHTTAISNDRGYDTVFVEQLESLMSKGDLVIGISASGNSENVLKALEYANSKGAISVAIVGFSGGKMKEVANHSIHIPSKDKEYGPVEDVHLILNHMVCSYLIQSLTQKV